MTIAIVGAGIAGLTLARVLELGGITDITIFERSTALTSRGGTIRLDGKTQRALKQQ